MAEPKKFRKVYSKPDPLAVSRGRTPRTRYECLRDEFRIGYIESDYGQRQDAFSGTQETASKVWYYWRDDDFGRTSETYPGESSTREDAYQALVKLEKEYREYHAQRRYAERMAQIAEAEAKLPSIRLTNVYGVSTADGKPVVLVEDEVRGKIRLSVPPDLLKDLITALQEASQK